MGVVAEIEAFRRVPAAKVHCVGANGDGHCFQILVVRGRIAALGRKHGRHVVLQRQCRHDLQPPVSSGDAKREVRADRPQVDRFDSICAGEKQFGRLSRGAEKSLASRQLAVTPRRRWNPRNSRTFASASRRRLRGSSAPRAGARCKRRRECPERALRSRTPRRPEQLPGK